MEKYFTWTNKLFYKRFSVCWQYKLFSKFDWIYTASSSGTLLWKFLLQWYFIVYDKNLSSHISLICLSNENFRNLQGGAGNKFAVTLNISSARIFVKCSKFYHFSLMNVSPLRYVQSLVYLSNQKEIFTKNRVTN